MATTDRRKPNEKVATRGFVLCAFDAEGGRRHLALAVQDEAEAKVVLANAEKRADVTHASVTQELPKDLVDVNIVGRSLAGSWYEPKSATVDPAKLMAEGRVRFSKDVFGPKLGASIGERVAAKKAGT